MQAHSTTKKVRRITQTSPSTILKLLSVTARSGQKNHSTPFIHPLLQNDNQKSD
ncbi:MAG: hypothetical protein ABNH03_00030 [Alteromonas sp.]|uniref:hypothetical protein n=1 Tax=Alteromonas sp. TaxID=232 RepID=UPI0032D8C82A